MYLSPPEHHKEVWEALNSLYKPGYNQGDKIGLHSRATSKFPRFIVAEGQSRYWYLPESTWLLSYRSVHHILFVVPCRSRRHGSTYAAVDGPKYQNRGFKLDASWTNAQKLTSAQKGSPCFPLQSVVLLRAIERPIWSPLGKELSLYCLQRNGPPPG